MGEAYRFVKREIRLGRTVHEADYGQPEPRRHDAISIERRAGQEPEVLDYDKVTIYAYPGRDSKYNHVEIRLSDGQTYAVCASSIMDEFFDMRYAYCSMPYIPQARAAWVEQMKREFEFILESPEEPPPDQPDKPNKNQLRLIVNTGQIEPTESRQPKPQIKPAG